MEYGLIGGVLGHSFSKEVHEMLADYQYTLCALPTEAEFASFMEQKDFAAINVTIPYKEKVMPYCHSIDARAKAIGAVNTIVNENGVLRGYNTDFAGFAQLTRAMGVDVRGKAVMILGTGGTQKTAKAALLDMGCGPITLVSRHKSAHAISYEEALLHTETEILVNASPVGMYPHTMQSPIRLDGFPRLAGVVDVVYNPLETALVADARRRGIPAVSGLLMLVAQARLAAEYFTASPIDATIEQSILQKMRCARANLVLVGMPSAGKTGLGKAAARMLGKRFVDIDARIEQAENMPIPQIFAQKGEQYFRDIETQCIQKAALLNNTVIATGGGAVLRDENVQMLRQNGAVLYLRRPLASLATGGHRPLSTGPEALAEMYARRAPLYEAACDAIVENDGAFADTAKAIEEAFYEVLHHQRP